jgi:ketosteroid isomerase-like protein
VELENGLRFLANFKYTLKPDISKNPTNELVQKFESLKTGDYNKFDSLCDQTMVGFVQSIPSITNKTYSLAEHFVQCFYGKQRTHYDMEKTVSVKTDSDTVKVAVITSQNKIVTSQ